MIEFRNISKRYDTGQLALYNVNLALEQGEMAFLTGVSGAGKSTLLRLIALLERPSKGEIIISGQNIKDLKKNNIASFRRNIGMIFQDHLLLDDINVFENIALPLRISGLRESDIKKRVHAALEKVDLTNKKEKFPKMLSAGEQQRIGIARAVVNRPSVILADEPTGNLDPELAKDIMKLFRQFNELGTTVLIASHDQKLIKSMKKRIIVLRKIRTNV